jgi:23S rRNA (uracil1939-C5)-methyltransferase
MAHVTGIESSPWAISDALTNRAEQEVVEFIQGNVEEVLPSLSASYDAVILDPPRAGCAPAALEALARCGASRIIYVSCDPATLARDVAHLATFGYELVEVQPMDMFPQTYHLESVALLRCKTSG